MIASQQIGSTSTDMASDSRQLEDGEQTNAASISQSKVARVAPESPSRSTATLAEPKESITTGQHDTSQVSATLGGLNIGGAYGYPLPSLTFDRSIRPYLTGDMKMVAVGIEGLIRNAVQRSHSRASHVTVSTRSFRERRGVELKFTVHTQLNPEQAFALWDAIGQNVEDWRTRLSARARRLLDEQVAISVEWQESDAD